MSEDFKNRRRFQRAIVKDLKGDLESLLGISARWPDGQSVDVYDISQSGMALTRPETAELKIGHIIVLKLKLPNHQPMDFSCEVVWCNEKIMGVNFEPLTVKQRLVISEFLDDKVIGTHLQLIDPKFYAPHLNCDYWYQGPFDTNVYIWSENQKIVKGVVELEDQVLTLENGMVQFGGHTEDRDSSYDRDDHVVTSKDQVGADRDIFSRVIDILSQVDSGNTLLKAFLAEVVKAKS